MAEQNEGELVEVVGEDAAGTMEYAVEEDPIFAEADPDEATQDILGEADESGGVFGEYPVEEPVGHTEIPLSELANYAPPDTGATAEVGVFRGRGGHSVSH